MPPRRNGRKRQQQQELEISPESSARPSPLLYPSPLPDYDEDEFVNQQTPAMHSKPPPRPVSPLPASSPQRPQTPLIDFEEAYAAEEQNSEAEAEEVGQQRTPVLARERTPMENISRTVRHSMHSVRSSVISIPTAAPSPPTVSRPVSFGSFLHGGDSQRTVHNRNPLSNAYDDPTPHSSIVASHTVPARGDDAILWTRWDTTLPDRRFLLVGYRSGIQIWDCSDLGRLNEILSTSSTKALGDGTIVHAAFIPHLRSADDPLQASRPLLGLVLQDSSHCSFVLYSLRTHRVVKKHRFTGTAIDFAASESCIVLSASDPASLYILSTISFEVVHTVPAQDLATTATADILSLSTTLHRNNNDNDIKQNRVLVDDFTANPTRSTIENQQYVSSSSNHISSSIAGEGAEVRLLERPVYALHGRLLAYACPAPLVSSAAHDGGVGPTKVVPAEVDVGAVAMKVGGTVLSGIKTLGGLAYRYGAQQIQKDETGPGNSIGKGLGNFFSKSAPAAAASMSGILPEPHREAGSFVRVVDLGKELMTTPTIVSDFKVSPSDSQALSRMMWSADGTELLIVPKDGHTARVFGFPLPKPLYSLKRGRTSAVVEGMAWANDGRWIAIGTRKGTIHVFPTNPYGGKPDGSQGHLHGRVVGMNEVPPVGVDVSPIARLRQSKPLGENTPPPAFTFLDQSSKAPSLPAQLLPSSTSPHLSNLGSRPSSYLSSSPTPSSPNSAASVPPKRPVNYQDMLVFNPSDGVLSLRRITLEARTVGEGSYIPITASISLPTGGRLPGTSPESYSSKRSSSGLSMAMASVDSGPKELVGKETSVATYNLKRGSDWKEVRKVLMQDPENFVQHRSSVGRSDWIAQAELSTFSKSTKVVPRSVYLSHQFAFYRLGDEDYEALLQLNHFGSLSGSRIDVRREVEVHGLGGNEDFGTLSPQRASASSFDDGLASAMVDPVMTASSFPPVLPMLPNGHAGTRRFSGSIPIRPIGDGVSESFGRLRRQVKRRSTALRSPEGIPKLEFDEEDEDFVVGGMDGYEHSPASARSATVVDTPDTSQEEDDGEDVQPVVDEVERFDHISAAGIMDEEREDEEQEQQSGKKKRKGKKGKR